MTGADHDPSLEHETVALVLAAGAGSRLGGVPKCLIRLGGLTLLDRQLAALAEVGIEHVKVVVGHHGDAIASHLHLINSRRPPQVLRNPTPGDDPADSLQLGLRSLVAMPERLLVLVSDLPLLGAPALRAALAAFDARDRRQHVLVPTVNGTPGHPAVLDAHACALLRNHSGGLRAWRRTQPEAVRLWATTDEAHVRDVDTPDDLARLAADTGLSVRLPSAPPSRDLPQCGIDNG
ncbi:MAG: NTP transferase domain-containing protein [Hydrogenophaga sp.]|uniref:nucleotidyltransferase family protein n=1 Tax=Hydrogenophaga sp. TaxID=1904254 RepID=UPI001D474F14|nr:NTP transferase domain-containing protein [Hydrogenophaga sp.]MBX3611356.1 NTP transferase domain-containing protein [Hydrogenophaga sp.]